MSKPLKITLASFQKEAHDLIVEFYRKKFRPNDKRTAKGFYLADGTGVGKSPTSVAIMHTIFTRKKRFAWCDRLPCKIENRVGKEN